MPQSIAARVLYEFTTACQTVTSASELFTLLLETMRKLGFDLVNVSIMRDPALPPSALKFGATNTYPDDWQVYYAEKDCIRFDPVVQRARGDIKPFFWNELPQFIDLTRLQTSFLGLSEDAGLYNGVAIPFFGSRSLQGGVALATSHPKAEHLRDLAVLGAIVDTFYRTLRTIHAAVDAFSTMPEPHVHLTDKEAEILTLSAQGYSDREIARLVNITENTVSTHTRKIYCKLGAKNRVQAATIGVKRGFIDLP